MQGQWFLANRRCASTIKNLMDLGRMTELLQPFLAAPLSAEQLNQISIYIDLLERWNARVNLTAVREPREIVTRHFGESLFAARHLIPAPILDSSGSMIDVGSGAGFPGLPSKIWAPGLQTILVESNYKKATFLREVIRTLALTNVDVYIGRAEELSGAAQLVTLRAVERFDRVLPVARHLLSANGRLALLIGNAQVQHARQFISDLLWQDAVLIPQSANRVLFVGAVPG